MPVGLNWLNWVGLAIEDDETESPYADIDPAAATGAAAPTYYLPLISESIKYNPNIVFSNFEVGSEHAAQATAGAQGASGTLQCGVPLGCLGAADDGKLFDLIFNRKEWPASSGDLYQLPSATIWVCLNNGASPVIKKVIGAKVGVATLESPSGVAWITLSLDIIGRSFGLVNDQVISATDIFKAIYGSGTSPVAEYLSREAYLKLSTFQTDWTYAGSGMPAYATDFTPDLMGWSIRADNKLMDDGYRVDGTGLIRRLYNQGQVISGSFSEDFRSTTNAAAFIAGTEMAAYYLLHRPDVGLTTFDASNITLKVPRIKYMDADFNIESDKNSYTKASYSWQALQNFDAEGLLQPSFEVYEGVPT